MSSYSVKTSSFNGDPIIEILCNGKEWGETHPRDENFRFGVTRARLILAAKDLIREFVESEGNQPATGVPIEHTYAARGRGYTLTCRNYAEFNTRSQHVQQPYLRLSSGRYAIGFGLAKAEALVVLMEKIERFVMQNE